nr:MAG TPA_asm: abhydrolase domain-containing protein [Caudoviricetes sp.]
MLSFNTIQRYRFFIEGWGQRELWDLRWNRRERGREGCYFKLGGSGVVPTI